MISVLQNNGVKVPDDLSVITSGNYSGGQSNKVKLTVIDNQLAEMCRIGLQTMQDILNNNKIKSGLRLLTPKIFENASVINFNQN